MYIYKLKIRNFRTFGADGVSFLFDKGINVVIGENNSGKSAVIDAIRLAFSCVSYKKDIYFNKTDFHIGYDGQKAMSANIDIYLKDVPKKLIEIWDPEEPECGEFHIVFSLEKTPSGHERVKCKAWGGKCEGNTLSSDTLEAINIAYLGALRDAENEMKPSRNSKLAMLLQMLASTPEEQDVLVSKLKNANQEILKTESLNRTKRIINENLFDLEQPLLHQQIDLGLVEPKFESIMSSLQSWIVPRWNFVDSTNLKYNEIVALFDSDDLKSLIQVQSNGAFIDIDAFLEKKRGLSLEHKELLLSLKKHSFELYQNGLGYNNLLFVSAVLGDMSFEKLGIYSNLFLVEEPEAHLHPQLQELVLDFFCKKVRESDKIQVIMTSHSPTLVSRVGIKHINLLYEQQHMILNYPFINCSLSEEENDYLEKYLDVTKSQLFFAKGIIFIEGISEAILLPEFAKIIERPLDMYSVELVNVNGVSFSPFTKIIKIPNENYGFAKTSIITDDDRCSNKNDKETYISKDLDFDDNLSELGKKIDLGKPSERYKKISTLCADGVVKCYGAIKTFEYELALIDDNVPYIVKAIETVYPDVGKCLKEKIKSEPNGQTKALMIWLFIQSRNSAKAQVAQALGRLLKKQIEEIESGKKIDKPFVIPEYIQKAIYNVTREPEVTKE